MAETGTKHVLYADENDVIEAEEWKGEKNIMKKTLHFARLLMAAVMLSGLWTAPMAVSAKSGIPDMVIYDNQRFQMSDYWQVDGEKAAPVLPGYVFGGWYEDDQGACPLTEVTAAGYEKNTGKRAYAKFVPAYVLSVKAQNKSGTRGSEEKTDIRIMTSVDSGKYQNVGITLLLDNKIDRSPNPTQRVYTGVEVTEEGKTTVFSPTQVFGTASELIAGWRLINIAQKNYSKILYVRPYWTTMDGTRVEGLAKYVHVEDGYKNLVSVPVNLMTNPLSENAIAAGALKVTCNDDRFEFYDVQVVENGKIFAKLDYHADGNAVKFVGTVAGVGKVAAPDGIMASVRFRLKAGQVYTCGEDSHLVFTVSEEDFRNWDEKPVTVNAQDIRH